MAADDTKPKEQHLVAANTDQQEPPMSAAPKDGAGGAGARPPEPPGGASSGPPAPSRAATGGGASASASDTSRNGGGTGRNNEMPIDMTASSAETETDGEEDNTTNNYVNGKRRRGGVGARRPAAADAVSDTATAPAGSSNSHNVSAQPQQAVEAAPVSGTNEPKDSHLLGPIDVDAIVFGPGGLHHDPEADERERLARERLLQQQQQQQQQRASAAAGTSTTTTIRQGVSASTGSGSAMAAMKKTPSAASSGGSNQGVVAAAAAAETGAKTPAGASTLASKSTSASARTGGASSGSMHIKSKGASINSKPTSSARVRSAEESVMKTAAATATDPSKVHDPSITDAVAGIAASSASTGSGSRPEGVDGTVGATVVNGGPQGDKPVGAMVVVTANRNEPTVGEDSVNMSSGEEKKSDDGDSLKAHGTARDSSSPVGVTSAISATPKQGKSKRKTMNSILRKRLKGREHDEGAIDACVDFIQTQLMTKNCLTINSSSTTKCSCIQSLNPSLVRSVATYVATTWSSMKDDEKINKILGWRKEKTAGPLPFSLEIATEGSSDSTAESHMVCSNGLAEVMGISHSLWRRAVQREVELKKKKETGVEMLEEAFAFVDAEGSDAVESCADFIKSYLMKKNCTDRSLGAGTSCSCIKDLDEALIPPAAAFVASTWGKMDKKEKAKQLEVWISNQANGPLPFGLPIKVDPLDSSQPHGITKMICRNALIEMLCIPLPMWKKAYGRAVTSAISTSATHSSQPKVPIAPATGSALGHPDVNPSVFGPIAGNPAMWAQFHAQAMATSANLAASSAQRQTTGGESSMRESQRQDDSYATSTAGRRDEIPAGDMVPRQEESQPSSGGEGQQSAVMPVKKQWRCDKCKHHVFHSFDEAQVHEETCNGTPEAADEDNTLGQLHQSANEVAASNKSASNPPSVTSGEPKPTLSTPSQGTSQGAAAAQSAPNPPSRDDDVKYMCDKCKVAAFESFDDACRHESTCVGATPKEEKSPVMAFTPRKATDEEIAADAAATFELEHLTNLATLCKQERWADIANLISANPLLSSAIFTVGSNTKTTVLHQVIASSGDVNGRAGLVRSLLTARPSAATIRNGYGSLPIHVLLQPSVNMKAKLKEELVRGLIHAYPASISIAGGVSDRTPLHILFTRHMSADLSRLMLTLRPEAAKMRDKNGWLPIHIACSRHCSLESLRLLIDACPESIRETTNDGKTPLMLARSTVTKRHPNMALIEELTSRIGAGSEAAADSKLPANQEAQSCENTTAELLLAVSTSPKRATSAEKVKSKPAKQEEDVLFIGQDVWVKCGVGLQAEHEAMVVSRGKADNTKITIRWAIAGYDQTVDIGLVRAMYSAEDLDKPERETSTKSTPAPSAKRLSKRRLSPRPAGASQCGSCDACMVDDCGKCKSCQDKPRFGGPNKSKKKCLHRPACTVRTPGTAAMSSATRLKSESKPSAVDTDTPITTPAAPLAKSSGQRRTKPRTPNKNQCGICDACMVDDCGKCRYCLDKPRFGGPHNLRRSCLNRPPCTVAGPSTKVSETTPAQHGRSKANAPASSSAKSTSFSAAKEYEPPVIRVGTKIMKYFTVEGGDDKSYFEGTLKRLPITSSPYYFVVYTDGDKEEISELDFWSAYSDYRVQKGMVQPSEFVPESLVVANDGRLGQVLSFRPVSNGIETTWSYRVRFKGFSAKYDKWMLEVDLRKQTPATLKWAERVRAAVKRESGSSKRKPASVGVAKPSHSRQTTQSLTRPKATSKAPHSKATSKAPRGIQSHSYPLRHPGPSHDSAAPTAKRIKTSSSQEAVASDNVRHSRRAAAADARAAMSKTAGPKRLKKGKKSPSPSNNMGNSGSTTSNDTLPDIGVGTAILKYFAESKSYHEGKITKVPGPGYSFYHVRYDDGDEEDMEPNEMWVAVSDWYLANGELALAEFEPEQQVYAVDCLGVPREATILSFRPVEKDGSDQWTWSYLVHFLGWNSRHDDWIDEINIYKATPANKKWAEGIQEEVERRRQRGSQSKSSSRSSTPTPSPSRSSIDDSRKRERAADSSKSNSNQREGWQCDRCDEMNETNLVRCSGCSCWKDSKMRRRIGSRQDRESQYKETASDEDSVASVDSDDGWSCPICDEQHGPDALTCVGTCKGIRRCLVLRCTEACEKDCDGMCSSHYQEAVEASEGIYDKDDDDDDDENDVAIEVDDAASTLPNESRERKNTTEVSGDGGNEEVGAGASPEMAGGNADKISSVEGSSGDSNTARDDNNINADTSSNSSNKDPDADDGKMPAEGDTAAAGAAAAAASSTGSVGAPGESGEPIDGVDVSSPQPAAAASSPARPTGRTPNFKNVLAALRQGDSDDDGDDGDYTYDEVFGYFGAGL